MIQQEPGTVPTLQASPFIAKVNSDNLESKQIESIMLFPIFIWVLLLYCNLFVPNAHQSQSQSPCNQGSGFIEFANYDCQKEQKNEMTNPKALYIENYVPAQLFLLVKATITFQQQSYLNSTENITYSSKMWEVSKENGSLVEIIEIYQPIHQSIVVNCRSNDLRIIVCDSFDVAYIPQMTYKSVLILVELISEQKSHLLQLQVTGISTSITYTYTLIAFHYTFMILSIISALWYTIRLYRQPSIYHVIEQKMILVLSILVIFYNNPIYAITVLTPNQISTMLSVFFLANFYAYSLLFLMVVAHRMVHEYEGMVYLIPQQYQDTKAINWMKVSACLILWVCTMISYSILELDFFSDPLQYYDKKNTNFFIVFQVIGILTGSFILIFIFRKSFHKKRVLQRYVNQECFQIFFTLCLSGLLIGEFFQSQKIHGFIILQPILNIQVYQMQLLWAPSQDGIKSLDIVTSAEIQSYQNKVQEQLGNLIIEEIKSNDTKQQTDFRIKV